MNNHEAGKWVPYLSDNQSNNSGDALLDNERSDLGEPNNVVGLGAICDLSGTSEDGRAVSYSVSEFALLEDGRKIILRDGLGFTIGWGAGVSSVSEVWRDETPESITRDVLNTVLPDDDDTGEDHPWEWLAELARGRGLMVTAGDLRGLPYEVELTDRVLELLSTP